VIVEQIATGKGLQPSPALYVVPEMKSTRTMVVDAIITTFCIAGGFCIAELIGVPAILIPTFLLPAAILISKLGYIDIRWMKALLYLLLLGGAVWVSGKILGGTQYAEFDILFALLVLVPASRFLGRIYDSIADRISERHNKSALDNP